MNLETFWDKVKKTSSCWFWTAGKTDGYGQWWYEGKNHKAHRVSYEDSQGPIPKDKEIDHLCANRSCVNPEHLDIVDHKTNLDRTSRKYTSRTTPSAKKSFLLYIHNPLFKDEPKKSALVNELLEAHYAQFRGMPNPHKDGLPPYKVVAKVPDLPISKVQTAQFVAKDFNDLEVKLCEHGAEKKYCDVRTCKYFKYK